jgi:quercetin dioxygenase-like cupin family protein
MLSDELQNLATACLVNWKKFERFDVIGPTVQFLTPISREQDAPCIMRGTVPSGVVIPLHSHGDPETFVHLAGEFEGLCEQGSECTWIRIRPGDVFHVPGGAKHAFRNRFAEPAVSIIVTTGKLASFLKAIGVPVAGSGANANSFSPERIRKLLTTAEQYGYWNATPEENARIGVNLPPLA